MEVVKVPISNWDMKGGRCEDLRDSEWALAEVRETEFVCAKAE